ncbi:MAG TPA: FAD-binding oxidoreductase [Solirubrobacteraceae bacterium]|nr:FAD-binding oxidoreductase [Solirubrobacteraceae bacterium]
MTDMLTRAGADAGVLRPGLLVTPADAGWDAARQAWNLAIDQRPAAVALPESDADVVAVVRWAAERDLRVAAQGTGHNAGPLAAGGLGDVVLVKTHRMRGVEIEPAARIARVEAGALWKDVVGPAAEHGLAALSGSSPDVGVVGYTLGGGISWLARRYGFAANSVVAIELVTADGELVRADAEHHADLFWALRGGGGNFGVVTALELELFELTSIEGGMLMFGVERAGEVFRAWREWAAGVPETVTSSIRILRLPPLPELPEELRGGEFVVVEPYVIAAPGEAGELVAPLRALRPDVDSFRTIPMAELVHAHMDPEEPVPAMGDHVMLEDVGDATIDAIVEQAGAGSGTSLLMVELRQLGGAIARRPAHAGAVGAIEAGFAAYSVGMVMGPEMGAAVAADLAKLRTALAPFEARRSYLNFAEQPTDSRRLFDEATYARLRAIRAAVDPGERFVANHAIPAA